jgi:hypothetical protein
MSLNNQTTIFYCKKCGLLQKGILGGIDEFRKHIDSSEIYRCLDVDEYKGSNSVASNVFFYVMEPLVMEEKQVKKTTKPKLYRG